MSVNKNCTIKNITSKRKRRDKGGGCLSTNTPTQLKNEHRKTFKPTVRWGGERGRLAGVAGAAPWGGSPRSRCAVAATGTRWLARGPHCARRRPPPAARWPSSRGFWACPLARDRDFDVLLLLTVLLMASMIPERTRVEGRGCTARMGARARIRRSRAPNRFFRANFGRNNTIFVFDIHF